MIPKFSAPLTKAIRTTEGILVIVVNIALGVVAGLQPHRLPPEIAAVIASANTGLLVASRSLLKIFAIQKGIGIAPPDDAAELKSAPTPAAKQAA